MSNLFYIDIFAGCGGLSLGLCNAGFKGVFAVEKNIDAFSTLKHNLINSEHFEWPDWLTIQEHDINSLMKNHQSELQKLQGKVDLVAGGPPCQGFSMAGKRDSNDKRNKLVKSYVKFIKLVQPRAIIFENVHGFTVNFSDNTGKTKKYSSYVVNALRRAGYKTDSRIVDLSEFGVPQARKRFILVAYKDKKPDKFFEKLYNNRDEFLQERNLSYPISIKSAIGDLEKAHGTVKSPDSKRFRAGVYGTPTSNYQKLLQNKNLSSKTAVDSHRFVNHSRKIVYLHKTLLNKAPRGKRITPSDKIVRTLKSRGVTVLNENAVAPTITSTPDELVHYKEPRILTVREHARIQSFPDWYEFKGKYTSGGKRRKLEVPRYTQVGNAVPPLFAEQLGLVLKEELNDEE